MQTNQSNQGSAFTKGDSNSTQHYNTPAIQIGNAVRDGDEFILLVRSRQSEDFQVWSSGDDQVTEQLYKQAAPSVALRETTT
jgi:hypothetical protein